MESGGRKNIFHECLARKQNQIKKTHKMQIREKKRPGWKIAFFGKRGGGYDLSKAGERHKPVQGWKGRGRKIKVRISTETEDRYEGPR